jgi:hypothetical protein
MTFIRNRRIVATIVTASCIAVPASAYGSGGMLAATDRSDAAQASSQASTDRSDAAQAGWLNPVTPAFPSPTFRGGDAPADHPGMGNAPTAAPPTTVEVVRPVQTIVRDVDEVLPLILSSIAMLLVLAAIGVTLVRSRMLPGRSH